MAGETGLGLDELAARLRVIESDLDAGRYRPGPWARLIEAVRNQPDGARAALAADISRVSRKLHLRDGKRTIGVGTGIVLELVAAVIGAVALIFGIAGSSNSATIVAALIWVTAFQPLVKVAIGRALGVGYDYGFLYGIEPRFKMSFGTYIAAPRWKRIALHTSGMVGSPLGAIIVALTADGRLRVASVVCWVIFWIGVGANLGPLVAAFLGVRRLGSIRAADSSGGSVGIELREAAGL